MLDWFEANATAIAPVAVAVAAVLFVACVVLVVARRRAVRSVTGELRSRANAERELLDLELTVRELDGRLRIVRELDEVAVHAVSQIVSNAQSARFTAEVDASAAVRALDAIEQAASKTLADLRRILNVLGDDDNEIVPPIRIADLHEVVATMRASGLDIDFTESGEPFDLPRGAELAVYRLVQVTLENSLTHGGVGTAVTVSLAWRDESLQVLIDDDGVQAKARRDGVGEDTSTRDSARDAARETSYTPEQDLSALTGFVSGTGLDELRERVELFGGVFNAYPVPGVGFSISAVFPSLKYDNGVHGVNLRDSRGEN